MVRRHEEEENYWPGFVDALSTIVMVVTLLMIILVIVIFVITQMIDKSTIQADVAKAPVPIVTPLENEQNVGVVVPNKSEEVKQTLELETNNTLKIQSRIVIDEKKITVASEEKAELDPKEKKITVNSAQSILSVLFEGNGVELNEEASLKITDFLTQNAAELEGQKITIWSFYDPNSSALSQAKRKAYFRLLSVRNILITNGLLGNNLTVNVRPAQNKEDNKQVRVFVK